MIWTKKHRAPLVEKTRCQHKKKNYYSVKTYLTCTLWP